MLRKDNCKPRWEAFEFWDLVRLILEILQYLHIMLSLQNESPKTSNTWSSLYKNTALSV